MWKENIVELIQKIRVGGLRYDGYAEETDSDGDWFLEFWANIDRDYKFKMVVYNPEEEDFISTAWVELNGESYREIHPCIDPLVAMEAAGEMLIDVYNLSALA